MRNKKSIVISFLLLIVSLVLGAVFYNKMPDMLPTHFGFDGTADKYSSKASALFNFPFIMACVQALLIFQLNKDPRKKYQNEKLYVVSLYIIPILTLVISVITITIGLGAKVDVSKIVFIMISILFIVMGNFLPKAKRNYTMGIRNQWTLSSDYIWEKTHRVAGFSFVGSGILGLICAVLLKNAGFVIFGMIILAVIVPTIYSYVLYEREQKGVK